MLQSPNGERWPLPPGQVLEIGLDANGALVLAGPAVIQRLASLSADGREAWLTVTAGKLSTCVNGRPIQCMARLLAGDRICFGDTCLDVIGAAPGDHNDAEPANTYALRRRSGIGSGNLTQGGLIHLDRQGEPVSAAGGVVGLVLAEGSVYLDPGDAEVRVNGHRVHAEVSLTDGDNIQVGRQRYTLEVYRSPVFDMPAAPEEAEHAFTASPMPVRRGQHGLWWLLVAAAGTAAVLAGLLYFSGGA